MLGLLAMTLLVRLIGPPVAGLALAAFAVGSSFRWAGHYTWADLYEINQIGLPRLVAYTLIVVLALGLLCVVATLETSLDWSAVWILYAANLSSVYLRFGFAIRQTGSLGRPFSCLGRVEVLAVIATSVLGTLSSVGIAMVDANDVAHVVPMLIASGGAARWVEHFTDEFGEAPPPSLWDLAALGLMTVRFAAWVFVAGMVLHVFSAESWPTK